VNLAQLLEDRRRWFAPLELYQAALANGEMTEKYMQYAQEGVARCQSAVWQMQAYAVASLVLLALLFAAVWQMQAYAVASLVLLPLLFAGMSVVLLVTGC
jgi:hypothetical protein